MKRISALLLLTATSMAHASPLGDTAHFVSPNNLTEVCVATSKLPGATYFNADIKRETEMCSLNFYDESVVLCPKTWSTSPGTIVHDNRGSGLTQAQAEAKYCKSKNVPLKAWAKFKQSMNQMDTSATYSLSSIMYYHLSRALHAQVHVPVAVYRTMDRVEHYQRVSQHAVPMGRMNGNGWVHIKAVETSPETYGPHVTEILTRDHKQIYGIMVDGGGTRYGAEINGTRAMNSLAGQNFEIQKTPAFLALQSGLPAEQAMAAGSTAAFTDTKMAAAFPLQGALPQAPSKVQMNSWMREMSEIALLDTILDQQDRVGNIDYKWKWLYLDQTGTQQEADEKSELLLPKKSLIKVPAAIAAFHPVLVQKTIIADNDAGGSGLYSNEAKNAGMLTGLPLVGAIPKHAAIHHMALETYQQLQILSKDFKAREAMWKAFGSGLGLTQTTADVKKVAIIRANILQTAEFFRQECSSGQLMFDIVSDQQALQGQFTAATVANCSNP